LPSELAANLVKKLHVIKRFPCIMGMHKGGFFRTCEIGDIELAASESPDALMHVHDCDTTSATKIRVAKFCGRVVN
jgi:hypothetical protein